jgi:hypothetical protein
MQDFNNLTLEYLDKLPNLATGQADNLKIQTEDTRVWLSRITQDESQPDNQVTIEKLLPRRKGLITRGRHGTLGWITIKQYKAK